MNYKLLFEKLEEYKVRYVVCGGLAVNLHGIPRMTADVDIILDLTVENLSQFEKCVDELQYKNGVPIKISDLADELKRKKLVTTKNLIALSFFNYDTAFLALDVVIEFPILFSELWDKRVERMEGNLKLNVVSIDHLIKLKEFANRIQDRQDIYFLSKIRNGH